MKSSNTKLLLVLISFSILLSCKKDDEAETPTPTPPAVFTPLVTAVGTPVGGANSATIGSGGGSIFSDDGRLEIIFPANALSADTEISIQPITNECPSGAGLAYYLSPHGLQFNESVTLRFHYTAEDVVGSAAQVLEVATHYDDGTWHVFNSKEFDEPNSTVSISTTHFSEYGIYDDIKVLPVEATIQVNETKTLTLYTVVHDETEVDEELMTLGSVVEYAYPDGLVWTVNGEQGTMLDNGWMSPSIEHTTSTYTAPAHIDAMQANPAAVTVSIPFENATLSIISNITVEELGEQYTLHFEMDYATWNITSNCQLGGGLGYVDGFDVHITTIGNSGEAVIVNELSNLTPGNPFNSFNDCECQNMSFDQSSFVEFSNFAATVNSSNYLSFSYDYFINSSDDTVQCPGQDPATVEGTDVDAEGAGAELLPADSATYFWGLGTLKIVHMQ